MTATQDSAAPLSEDSRHAAEIMTSYPLLGTVPLARSRALVGEIEARLALPGRPLERVWDDFASDGGRRVPVRVYVPKPDSRDVLVYARGSGWVAGSLDMQDALVRRLAAAIPCTIVSVEYRLAPEHPFPCGLEDVQAAVLDVSSILGRGGLGAPRRLGVCGQSAGGNLAAGSAIALRDRGFALDIQVLIDAVLRDHRRADELAPSSGDFEGIMDILTWEWDQYVPRGEDISPLAAPYDLEDLAGLPPTVVFTAEHDILTQEGREYARRLADAGVPVSFHEVPGAIHGFLDHTRMGSQADREMARLAGLIRATWEPQR